MTSRAQKPSTLHCLRANIPDRVAMEEGNGNQCMRLPGDTWASLVQSHPHNNFTLSLVFFVCVCVSVSVWVRETVCVLCVCVCRVLAFYRRPGECKIKSLICGC